MFVESTRLGMLAKLSVAADVSPNHVLWSNFAACVEGDCAAWALRNRYPEDLAVRLAELAGPKFVDAFRVCQYRFVTARAVRDKIGEVLRSPHFRFERHKTLEDMGGNFGNAEFGDLPSVWWLDPFRRLLQMGDRMLVYLALTEVREHEWDEKKLARQKHQKRKRQQSQESTGQQAEQSDWQERYGLYDLKTGWKGRFAEAVTGLKGKQGNFSDTGKGIFLRYATLNRELAETFDRVVLGHAEPRDAVENLILKLHTLAVQDAPVNDPVTWLWKQFQDIPEELQQAAQNPSTSAPVMSDLLQRLVGRLRQPKLVPLAVQASVEFQKLLEQNPEDLHAVPEYALTAWMRHLPREFEDIEREPDDVLVTILQRIVPEPDTDERLDFRNLDREERGQDDRRWLRNAMQNAVDSDSTLNSLLDALIRNQVRGRRFVRLERLLNLLQAARILPGPAATMGRLGEARQRLETWHRWLRQLQQGAGNASIDFGPAWEIPSALQYDPDRLHRAVDTVTGWLSGETSAPASWDGLASIHAAVAIGYLDELADLMRSVYANRDN